MSSTAFFLGANTPKGFYSLFNELYNPHDDWNMYIIKGGPGTGKSSLMKKIAKEAEKQNYFVERILCSSDPFSLDGVIVPDLKFAIADGTSPHVINPVFPGVCEHIVDLGCYWDKNKLKQNSYNIKKTTANNSNFHKQCIKYLKASAVIEEETSQITKTYFKKDKADRFAARFCSNELSVTEHDSGKLMKRFLSAVSPIGIVVQYDSLFSLCDRIINISDNSSVISNYILNYINDYSASNNIDRIICMCPMNPDIKIEHIIFPNIRLGIFTSNMYHPMIKKNIRTVHSERFTDESLSTKHKNKMTFLKKSRLELIGESIKTLEKAKSTHDILESYYMSAMDFNGISAITDKLIKEIFNK